MQKWEYYIFSSDYRGVVKIENTEIPEREYLNKLGSEGWELVTSVLYNETSTWLYMKRPKL